MVTTIKQTEAAPGSYPTIDTTGWSAAAAALSQDMIWQRLEAYMAHRFSQRDVTWIVEGPGDWVPPLTPATVTAVECWTDGDGWQAVTPEASPLGGYALEGDGPYRITATVGGGTVPAAVTEAFRRLAEYMAAKPGKPGATSESIGAGSISLRHRRSPSWMAQAIQNSGAGDLLRTYRRA